MKMRKSDKQSIGFLSPNKVRWIPANSTKHRFGKFPESEVDEIIKSY